MTSVLGSLNTTEDARDSDKKLEFEDPKPKCSHYAEQDLTLAVKEFNDAFKTYYYDYDTQKIQDGRTHRSSSWLPTLGTYSILDYRYTVGDNCKCPNNTAIEVDWLDLFM